MRELTESKSAAVAALERRVSLLEARLQATANAVEVLERGPRAEPEESKPEEAVTLARELLLVATPGRRED